MVMDEASVNNIMSGIENTGGVLHNRKKLRQRFDIIKKLGQGTYGKVQLGINKETGQEVAIKTIKKCKIESSADLIRIRREVQIMSSVRHPNIIHIYEVFENREKMVLVMEYAAGGELYDYLSSRKVLPEEEARRIFRQIATAIYYCHKHKICHRDLKLENILLDEHGSAKIADFGLSNVFAEQRLLSTYCGSPLYASPEIVTGTPYNGPEVDCWSLGVLLYTMVYGAMPFDGTHFKTLVKQISMGDYFEPKKKSPASSLIREMLTVCPKARADVEKICSHWWVNVGHESSCLDIAEELASQTPVRLDLLLSLAPPAVDSEKLVVTEDQVTGATGESMGLEASAPMISRSQSADSVMDMGMPGDRRMMDIMSGSETAIKPSATKIITPSVDIVETVRSPKRKKAVEEDSSTETVSKAQKQNSKTVINSNKDTAEAVVKPDPQILEEEGAMCIELLDKRETKKPMKKKIEKLNIPTKSVEDAVVSQDPILCKPTENQKEQNKEIVEEKVENVSKPRKVIKKKVKPETPVPEKIVENELAEMEQENEIKAVPKERRKSRIMEKAEKFMVAGATTTPEIKAQPSSSPKKIVIPGVNVGEYRQSFERRASLNSTPPQTERKQSLTSDKLPDVESKLSDENLAKESEVVLNNIEKLMNHLNVEEESNKIGKEVGNGAESNVEITQEKQQDFTPAKSVEKALQNSFSLEDAKKSLENSISLINNAKNESNKELNKAIDQTEKSEELTKEQRVKNAVETISNAIPRMCMGNRKPPFAYGAFGRSSSLGPAFGSSSPSLEKLKVQVGPGDVRTVSVDVSTPEANLFPQPVFSGKTNVPNDENKDNTPVREKKKSTCEVVLSSTLPRRKTSTAEIKLSKPQLPNVPMSFKTEVEHRVGDLRSAPVRSPPTPWTPQQNRATSLEPDHQRNNTKERIIPIQVNTENNRPPAYQRTTSNSFRSGSLSRQSTLESDSEIPTSPGTPSSTAREPIRKSPREVIIPIAIEGGGYVTPRSGSVEPSETSSRATSRVGRAHRMGSIINDRDSEDESTFGRLHRHSSIGRDSDGEDGRFHLHRLRSSRPTRGPVEPSDSVSSGEDDDEDCFEILTAENLFSTLLSRVRSLTQRLNVEDGGHPGFPSSRLLGSGFGPHVPFWEREPSLTRRLNGRLTGPSWHRSMSREMGSDVGSVFSDRSQRSPSGTSTLPRGKKSKKHNHDASFDASYTDESSSLDLDLNDLDLSGLKLSQSDLDALSSLTPSLSRRIQNQLLAKLPPTQARKLSRTLSMRNSCAAEDVTNPKRINRSFSNSRKVNKSEDMKLDTNENVFVSNGNTRRSCESNVETDDHKYINNDVDNLNPKNIPLIPKAMREGSQPKTVNYKKFNTQDTTSESSSVLDRFIKEPSPASKINSVRTTPDRYLYGKYSPLSTDDSIKPFSYECKESTLPRSRLLPRDSKSPSFNLSSALDEIPTLTRRTSVNRGTPQRRISRFLRPDFFDTPRDESIYVKEKREREMETQKVLKEIRGKREQSMDRRSECAETSVVNNNNNNINDIKTENSVSCENNNSNPEDKIINNNVNDHVIEKDKIKVNTLNENNNLKVDNSDSINCNKKVKQKSKESKLIRPKSFPVKDCSLTLVNQLSNSNVKNSDLPDINQKLTENIKIKESKLIRPKSYPNSKISPPKDILNDRRSIEKESTPPITKSSEKVDKKDKIKSKIKEKSPPKEGLKTITNGEIDGISKTENKSKEKSPEKPVKVCKSFLQTIGQKFEKFRSDPKTKNLRKSANTDGKSPPKEVMKNATNVKSETKNVIKSDDKEKDKGKVAVNSDRKSSPSFINKTKKRGKVPPPVEVETHSNIDVAASRNDNSRIQSDIENGKDQELTDTTNASSLIQNQADTEKIVETKAERKSRIDNVIRSLRERSLPRGPMGLTESGLIKRAVSVEDMSGHLQASRKSVSKVLGLFKKIENKTDETARKQSDLTNNKRHSDNYEQIKSSNKISNNINSTRLSERPKSLLITNSNGLKRTPQQYAGAKSDSILTMTQLEAKLKNDFAGSIINKNCIDQVNGIHEESPKKIDSSNDNQNDTNKKVNRKSLKLDFSKLPLPKTNRDKSSDPDISENKSSDRTSSDATERLLDTEGSDINNKSSLLPSDETSSNTAFLSPCDESELTFDNWSDCSDLNTPKTNPMGSPYSDMISPNFDARSDYNDNHPHYQHIHSSRSQLSSPTFDNNNPESIIDRIRRKSFYSRFNEKKQKRKSSLVGAGAAKEYYNKPPIVDHCKYDELGNHKDRSHHHHYSKSHHDTVDCVRSNYRPKSRTDFSKPIDHNLDQYKTFTPKRRDTYCGLDYYNSIDRRSGLNDSIYGRSSSIVDRNSYVRSPNIYENHQRSPMDRYRSYGSSDLYGSRDLNTARDISDVRSPVLSPVRGYSGYHTYNPRLRRDSAANGRISEVLGDCATEHRSDIEKEAPISSEVTPQTG